MIKRSEQEWLDLFAQQEASNLSAAQFCKANDLCPKHFSLRKKQLTQREPSTASAFVAVAIDRSQNTTQPITKPALVMRYNASALYFDVAPHPDWLAQLLRALA